MILTEVEAEEFLSKNKFKIVENVVSKREKTLETLFNKLKKPVVMKISGKDVVHKKVINGVRMNIITLEEAKKTFHELEKIKGFQQVMLQEQLTGKEIILGVKKTDEFGQVLVFGTGGSNLEEKDVTFFILPLEKEIEEQIQKTKIGQKLDREEIALVKKNLALLENLCSKNPEIKELDINPLILSKGEAFVVDARIVF